MFTELCIRGVFKEYKRIFKCLLQLIQFEAKDDQDVFEAALLLLTDYIKMYGERVFGVLARDHKEDIINDYEVTIKAEDRYEFLKEQTRLEIYKYLVKSYYENKILTHINSEFQKLKLS